MALAISGCSGNSAQEHQRGEKGEDSSSQYAKNETYNEVRYGARLILNYDAKTNSFQGTVENTTNEPLKRVRVEVHLSNGMELGPNNADRARPQARKWLSNLPHRADRLTSGPLILKSEVASLVMAKAAKVAVSTVNDAKDGANTVKEAKDGVSMAKDAKDGANTVKGAKEVKGMDMKGVKVAVTADPAQSLPSVRAIRGLLTVLKSTCLMTMKENRLLERSRM